MTIRPAFVNEGPLLSEIAQAGKAHWGYSHKLLALWHSQLTITDEYVAEHIVRVAVNANGEAVGFYALERAQGRLWMQHLWLRPEWIGSGVGRQLFADAIERAQETGDTYLWIEADPNAEGFYRHMGCQRVGETITLMDGSQRVLPVLRLEMREGESVG